MRSTQKFKFLGYARARGGRRREAMQPTLPCADPPRWGVLWPAYSKHFEVLDRLVQATLRHANDLQCVRLFSILSDSNEVTAFKQHYTESANSLTLLSYEDVLRRKGYTMSLAEFQKRMHNNSHTCANCRKCIVSPGLGNTARRSIGGLKKIFGLLEIHSLGMTHGWILDAESLPFRTFSFARIFRDAISKPRMVVMNVSNPWVAHQTAQRFNIHMVDGSCAHRVVGLSPSPKGLDHEFTYRSTDYWFYSLEDLAAMIRYIESKHKCTTQCFLDIYAAILANEYSLYAAYMLHVAPIERRPEAVVLPDALEPVLHQMSPGSKPQLKMNLDLSSALFGGCAHNSDTSFLSHEQRLHLLKSPLFSWIQGWRFDFIGHCQKDAEELIREASHITWATSNYMHQVNVSRRAHGMELEQTLPPSPLHAKPRIRMTPAWMRSLPAPPPAPSSATLLPRASKSSGEPPALLRNSGESPTLQQHVQYKVVDASTITDARCSKVSLPLQRFFGDRLLNHSYCDGVVPTLEGALWMGGWHEPQVVYSILKPMRATGAFIDVGANAGLFSLVALSGNYNQVLSFEPQPGCADEMLFTHTYNGAPARWRIYNVGVGKTHQAFQVPGEGCGMNWQKTGKGRSWVAQGIPLSMIVSAMDQAGPAYLKIDCDGAEVSVVEAVLDLLPGKETNGFAYLPEMYVEVNPVDWRSFGKSVEQGLSVFRSLGNRYTEIYFFSAMTSSCEGIGLVSDAGNNLTEPYLFVSENHPPPGMTRWVGRFSRPQWILRVKDYEGLLNRCVTHTRQLNLWFAK